MAGTRAVTDTSFRSDITEREGLALVDFWAPWCGPCRFVGPIVEELAVEYAERVLVAKVNVDESPRTAADFHVSSIPTLVLFRDGKPIETVIGAVPKGRLTALLNEHL